MRRRREKEYRARSIANPISRDLADISTTMFHQQPPLILPFPISHKFKMIILEMLECLFPSNMAMLVWRMMRGMLVLGACKMMLLEFCPSQQHECLGGAFPRPQHRYFARALHRRVVTNERTVFHQRRYCDVRILIWKLKSVILTCQLQ
jgi:hypothetical protein